MELIPVLSPATSSSSLKLALLSILLSMIRANILQIACRIQTKTFYLSSFPTMSLPNYSDREILWYEFAKPLSKKESTRFRV